jgi:NADPH:quinone reductase-like Zn-dependent oxidoreductase
MRSQVVAESSPSSSLAQAAGVNSLDNKFRAVKPAWYPSVLPAVPGWDLAGVVEACGHAASRFQVGRPARRSRRSSALDSARHDPSDRAQIGDEVYACARRPTIGMSGCYAQHICLPEACEA